MHFDEGEPARVAPQSEFLDEAPVRIVLVIVGVQQYAPDLREQGRNRRIPLEGGAQGEEVHAMADQRFGVHQRLPGGRDAHDNILLAREAVQQGLEPGQQRRKQGAAVLAPNRLIRW